MNACTGSTPGAITCHAAFWPIENKRSFVPARKNLSGGVPDPRMRRAATTMLLALMRSPNHRDVFGTAPFHGFVNTLGKIRPVLVQLLEALRHDARGEELARARSVVAVGAPLADEEILNLVLHRCKVVADDLAHVRDLARAVVQAGHLQDDVDAGRYLQSKGGQRNLDVAHHRHGLEPGHRVARV